MEGSHHRRVVHRRRTLASRRLYLTQRTTSSIKRPSRSQGNGVARGRGGPMSPYAATRMEPRFRSITFSTALPDPIPATDYILESPSKCPNCRREILEKTLIEPA